MFPVGVRSILGILFIFFTCIKGLDFLKEKWITEFIILKQNYPTQEPANLWKKVESDRHLVQQGKRSFRKLVRRDDGAISMSK